MGGDNDGRLHPRRMHGTHLRPPVHGPADDPCTHVRHRLHDIHHRPTAGSCTGVGDLDGEGPHPLRGVGLREVPCLPRGEVVEDAWIGLDWSGDVGVCVGRRFFRCTSRPQFRFAHVK